MKYLITLVITIFLFDTAQSQVTQKWMSRHKSADEARVSANDIAVDIYRNVYVLGSIYNFRRHRGEMVTIKYDQLGVQQWVTTYTGPTDASVSGGGLIVDHSGNIYVAGTIASETNDLMIAKYNPAGAVQWVKTYSGSGNGREYFVDIAVDDYSNIYVLGSSNGEGGAGTSFDYVTIKYNSDGDELWVARYDGPSATDADYGDKPVGIAIDNVGNVYVTGRSQNEVSGSGFSFATVKYNSAGQQQWVQRYNLPEEGYSSEAVSISLDESGNIYVTGLSRIGSQPVPHLTTIKYDPDGVEEWVIIYTGNGEFEIVEAVSVNADRFGNIIVTGNIQTEDNISEYYAILTLTYSSSGEEKWVEIYNPPDNRSAKSKSTQVDVFGNIYTIGSVWNGSYEKTAVIKYNPAGELKWEIFHPGSGYGEEYFETLLLNDMGEILVSGTGMEMNAFNDITAEMVTIKYAQEAASTSMTMDAPAGSQIIEIAGTNGFSIGDHIVINPGGTTQEINVIAGFGSILLQTPLRYNHNAGERIELLISTSVDEHHDHIPGEYALSQNYPNPFNPSTTILYSLDDRQHVTLTVYDITGREVTRLVNEEQPAGRHSVVFDASRLATGVYFYTLRAGPRSETRKMVYIR